MDGCKVDRLRLYETGLKIDIQNEKKAERKERRKAVTPMLLNIVRVSISSKQNEISKQPANSTSINY